MHWTWWIEGGGQGVIGDPYVPGLSPAFDAKPSNWGWDAAAGFDYRFNGYWHVSADFRKIATFAITPPAPGLFR